MRIFWHIILLVLLANCGLSAQRITSSLPLAGQSEAESPVPVDTVVRIRVNPAALNRIPSLRARFGALNGNYSTPLQLSEKLTEYLKKDALPMSEQALYWIHFKRDPATIIPEGMTFKDTVIVNPIFMPAVFQDRVLSQQPAWAGSNLLTFPASSANLWPADSALLDFKTGQNSHWLAYRYLEYRHPSLFRYSFRDFPDEVYQPQEIRKEIQDNLPLLVESEVNFDSVGTPVKFIPDRRYWKSGFESAVQFSQNYISPNWYKGGSSNLNLFTTNLLKYDYEKDKIRFTNEAEFKVSLYNAPNDTLRAYRVGDDLFRLHSNFGYKAFSKWYYTFDAEFRTQLFTNFKENLNEKQAAILAPFSVTWGIGMKYDLNKALGNKYRNAKLEVNLAPLSYTFMYSLDREIDLGRHGFGPKSNPEDGYEHSLSRFGSSIRTALTFNFNRNVSWQSRIYYFTSYDRTVGEFENTLTMAISRFFSTRIYAHLRFDDGATRASSSDSYVQLNELLSFGFNYKW